MPTVTSKNLAEFNQAEMERRGQIEPKAPNINDLAAAVTAAVERHVALPVAQRVANSRAAQQTVSQFVGTNKKGIANPLLSINEKLAKASKGKDGGEPITLDDGRGVETIGLALSPAYTEGKFNTCPNSASCKKICLGKTAGGYFMYGGGGDLDALKGPRLAGYNKTQALLREPGAFGVRIHDEIQAAKTMAAMNGNHLGVRMNVLSDLHPKVWKSIMEAHPDVTFYDYTKNSNVRPIAPNHHLTYSSTGASNSDLGVENPNQNWHAMRKHLEAGRNVAMAFSHKSELPDFVHDEETGQRYHVVSGENHDFRPLDGGAPDGRGYIVALRNRAATTTAENAVRNSEGFFHHFDPQYKTDAKGKVIRDETQPPEKVDKNGKATYPAIPTNKVAVVGRQKSKTIFLDNNSNPVHMDKDD